MTRQQWTPKPTQLQMREHLLEHPRAALWAPMGQGKTSTVLTALDTMFLTGEQTKPALVIAPLRVAQSTWPDEVAKWEHLSHLEVQNIHGSPKQRLAALANSNAAIFTINYEQLTWLLEHFKTRPWPFGLTIPDEATRLKNLRVSVRRHPRTGKEFLAGQGGTRARALARQAFRPGGMEGVWELTGTPTPQGLQDLWGQLWFLDMGKRLGRTFEGFESRWFQRSFDGYGLEPLPFAYEQIMERCRDLCLSVEPITQDVPIVRDVLVDLPPSARAVYEDMERRMFTELAGHEVEAFNAAARTMKCLQIANGALYVEDGGTKFQELHDAKLDALESIVTEAAGAPVLVAYHFKSDLARMRRAFPKGRVLDTNPQTIRDWNQGRIPILFAHPESAGHGLNLQDGGNIVVFFGHWWALEQRLQIIERIGPARQLQAGHPRPVYQYNIIARDTVDEEVVARTDSKRSVQDAVLAYMQRKHK